MQSGAIVPSFAPPTQYEADHGGLDGRAAREAGFRIERTVGEAEGLCAACGAEAA